MSIENVKKDLGGDAELFDFEEKDGVVAAKLKKFYRDRNEFAKIAKRVKENAGGVYVPKDQGGPYFKFEGEGGMSTAADKKDLPLKDAIAYAETVRTQLGYFIEKLKELQQ